MGAGLATPIPPTAFRVLETGRKVPVESNKFQTLGAFRVQHVSNTGLLLTESGSRFRWAAFGGDSVLLASSFEL